MYLFSIVCEKEGKIQEAMKKLKEGVPFATVFLIFDL